MEKAGSLDHRSTKEFEALLLERRAKLQESVRARMTERRTGEPRRSAEEATNAVESLGADLEVAMLDRESREARQIDAALERLARDEYGICRDCGTVIALGRLRALPFAQRCTECQAGVEMRERAVEAGWRPSPSRAEPRRPRPAFAVRRSGGAPPRAA
jgi:DnaK suppressor protein